MPNEQIDFDRITLTHHFNPIFSVSSKAHSPPLESDEPQQQQTTIKSSPPRIINQSPKFILISKPSQLPQQIFHCQSICPVFNHKSSSSILIKGDTLWDYYKSRSLKSILFTEEQIWSFLKEILQALMTLQKYGLKHTHLKEYAIYRNGPYSYQLMYHQEMRSAIDLSQSEEYYWHDFYLPPQKLCLIKSIEQKRYYKETRQSGTNGSGRWLQQSELQNEDSQKQGMFQLGMMVLNMMNPQQFNKSAYNQQAVSVQWSILEEKLVKSRRKYSFQLVQIVQKCLCRQQTARLGMREAFGEVLHYQSKKDIINDKIMRKIGLMLGQKSKFKRHTPKLSQKDNDPDIIIYEQNIGSDEQRMNNDGPKSKAKAEINSTSSKKKSKQSQKKQDQKQGQKKNQKQRKSRLQQEGQQLNQVQDSALFNSLYEQAQGSIEQQQQLNLNKAENHSSPKANKTMNRPISTTNKYQTHQLDKNDLYQSQKQKQKLSKQSQKQKNNIKNYSSKASSPKNPHQYYHHEYKRLKQRQEDEINFDRGTFGGYKQQKKQQKKSLQKNQNNIKPLTVLKDTFIKIERQRSEQNLSNTSPDTIEFGDSGQPKQKLAKESIKQLLVQQQQNDTIKNPQQFNIKKTSRNSLIKSKQRYIAQTTTQKYNTISQSLIKNQSPQETFFVQNIDNKASLVHSNKQSDSPNLHQSIKQANFEQNQSQKIGMKQNGLPSPIYSQHHYHSVQELKLKSIQYQHIAQQIQSVKIAIQKKSQSINLTLQQSLQPINTLVNQLPTKIAVFIQGNLYYGPFKNGRRNGYGLQIFPQNQYYLGHFQDDLFHGQGFYFWNKNQYFLGLFQNGSKVFGNLIGPKINYTGQFKNSKKMNGIGIGKFRTGQIFTGYWKQGKRHGPGQMIEITNDKFIGLWQNGKKSGYGQYLINNFPQDGLKIKAIWYRNDMISDTIVEYANGNQYEGPLHQFEKHGKGLYRFKKGGYFKGTFYKDNPTHGQLLYRNGQKYIGSLRNMKRHGFGEYHYSDGTIKKGNWIDDVRVQKDPVY